MTDTVSNLLEDEFGIRHIPCYGWFTTLLSRIKPDSLNRCMMKFVQGVYPELIEELEKEMERQNKKKRPITVACDGKTVRSTASMVKYDSPLHIVSAYASEIGMVLGQKSVEGKSNEIPAMRELVKSLEISGCIVVADALNCQVGTAQAVFDSKTEKGHGRIETRTAFTTNDVAWMPGGREWPGLRSIGAIKTRFEYKGKVTEEWHYYISSADLSADDLMHHAKMEWGVESMHWLLDVRYREDYSRIQNENIQKNMNMARKLALNIARIFKNKNCPKKSMSQIMFDCLMSPHHLLTVLGKN